MDNDIEKFVKICNVCSKHRPTLKDSTDKWKEYGPWERLHTDWLYEQENGNVPVIADAGSGWLEGFPCTERSTGNVVRCLRTIFSALEYRIWLYPTMEKNSSPKTLKNG